MATINIISRHEIDNFPNIWYDIISTEHFWIQWRFIALYNQLKKNKMPFEKKLIGLEVGCGNGLIMKQIENNTPWVVDGADMNPHGMELISNNRGKLYLYDIYSCLPEFKEKYDFLILFDILEHIEEPKKLLEACLFHLKNGGFIMINVPAFQYFFSKYDKALGHLRRYNKNTLRNEYPNRVREIDIRYWGFSLYPLIIIRKIFNNKKNQDEIIKAGMLPPNNLFNNFFKMLMYLETALFKKTILGCSLLCILEKNNGFNA